MTGDHSSSKIEKRRKDHIVIKFELEERREKEGP
jgi:hypothetical protein